ncbi:MAG: sugar kinase [Anaerolineae bacterium]|nr:sugar kinase [Anaerolineae bacterium]
MSISNPDIEVMAIGETLIDFISTEPVERLRDASTFRRYLGGSPTNIAVNVAKLGGRAAIISKTGIGAFGQFLKGELQAHGVNTDYMIMDHRVHTTFVFVSQTSGTPEFEPSRNGDYKLAAAEVSAEAIDRARVVHASTWPLSRQPSRSAVEKAFKLAYEQGKIVSLDPNYTPIVWPDYQEAQKVLAQMYRYVTITKASLDDAQRLFGPNNKPEAYIERLHALGPRTVVFTMGKEGSLISQDGRLLGHLPARAIKVVDATGAGDAFWAGFLVAMLDGHPPEKCLLFAREIVEMKLTTVGALPNAIDRHKIYARLPEPSTEMRPPPTWPR